MKTMGVAPQRGNRSGRMSSGETSGPIHPVPTQRSGFRYHFYDKHHGRGGPAAAQWLPSMGREDEFAVFDTADLHEILDERGWLYGIRRTMSEGRSWTSGLGASRSPNSPGLAKARHGTVIRSGL